MRGRDGHHGVRVRGRESDMEAISPTLLQEIEAEMGEKEVLLSALNATSQNIIEEFSAMKEEGGEEGGEGTGVREKV